MPKLRLLLTLFLFFTLVFAPQMIYAQSTLFLPDLKTAQKHYKQEDYQTALLHWQALADKNIPEAQLGLGKLYARGLGVSKDHKLALKYFMQAAEKNSAKAQYEIARAYQKGRGITKDLNKAETWYLMSFKNGYTRSYQPLIGINPNYKNSLQHIEANKKKYKIKTLLKSQFISEDNLSLGGSDDHETATVLEGRVTASYEPIKDIRISSQLRGVHTTGSAQSNNDDDSQDTDLSFIEMRQAWAEFKNLFNHPPLSLKIGRQRLKEERGNWWNRDLDAIRINYNTTLTSGFFAIGENLGKYRVGNDSALEQDEQQRFRILGEASHQLASNNTIEGRFLYEYDHSGLEGIGKNILSDDRDEEDYNLLWVGARAKGPIPTLGNNIIKSLHYRADIMSVIGKEETITTQSGATSDLRVVSGRQNRNVQGWAFDSSLETKLNHWLNPIITLGYAFASGDDGQGNNNAFRQTGLDSNTSLFPKNRVRSSLRNYGEVLKPELSNIHILNLGLNMPILKSSDFNLHYFNYWRANENTGIPSNGINTRLSGNDHYIGQAFDMITNINLAEEMMLKSPLYQNINLRLKIGTFLSGDAYGTAHNKFAYKGTAEIQVKF